MPASLALFFGLFGRSWKLVASRRKQNVVAPPVQWRAVRRAQCDFCGEGDTPVDYDLRTMIPSTAGARQALICQRCAAAP